LLIGATVVSLFGNVAHAVLPYIPRVVIQVGAAIVPPTVLLAAVHGIAVAVRGGASGTVYRWAVGSVTVIGMGAFTVSFLALRDLMQTIGYSAEIAWVFPAIIDTTVAVSTLMLVALGDKPARRPRAANTSFVTQTPERQRATSGPLMGAKSQAPPSSLRNPARTAHQSVSTGEGAPSKMRGSAQSQSAFADADLASDLIATGATTQPVETVIAVLAAIRRGASINRAATESGINFRTAQRIARAAESRSQDSLQAAC